MPQREMGAGRGSVFALTLYDTDHEFEEELAFELSWMWQYGIMASKDMHPYSSLPVPQESGNKITMKLERL